MLIDQKQDELVILAFKEREGVQFYATLVEVHYLEERDNSCTIFKHRDYYITSGLPTVSKTLARQPKNDEAFIEM